METRNQELKRIEENLKGFLREQTEKQAAKHDKAIQELREWQTKDMEEVRSLLLNIQPVANVNVNSPSDSLNVARNNKENGFNKRNQPKLTRLEFPKFNGEGLQ